MSDSVLRAQDFYTPPPRMRADAWAAVAPATLVIAWYEERLGRRLRRPASDDIDGGLPSLWARVDAGRWVAQCPCGSAQVVTPDDQRMFCVECHTGWYPAAFPEDVEAVEQQVSGEPAHARFWWHDLDPMNPVQGG